VPQPRTTGARQNSLNARNKQPENDDYMPSNAISKNGMLGS